MMSCKIFALNFKKRYFEEPKTIGYFQNNHNGLKRNQMLHLEYNCMVLVHLLVH